MASDSDAELRLATKMEAATMVSNENMSVSTSSAQNMSESSREVADGLVLASMLEKLGSNCDDSSEDDSDGEDSVNNITSTENNVIDSKSSEDKKKVAEKHRRLGRRAFKKKEFEKAISHLEEAIELDPKEVSFRHRLAETKFKQGKYEECIEYCSKAIKVGKENKGSVKIVARSQALRGRAWKEQGDVDKARADVQKAVTFLTTIAIVKLEKQRYFEAFDFLSEAFYGTTISEMSKESFLEDVFGTKKKATFFYKVSLECFDDRLKGHLASLDGEIGETKKEKKDIKEKRQRFTQARQRFTQAKHLGDEALKKTDYKTAFTNYLDASMIFPNGFLSSITRIAAEAEIKEKWKTCYYICHFEIYEISGRKGLLSAEELRGKLTEARARKSKAFRRLKGLDESFDKKVSEDPMARNVNGDQVLDANLLSSYLRHRKALSSYATPPDSKSCQALLFAADFSGSGKVTLDEFRRFFNRYIERGSDS